MSDNQDALRLADDLSQDYCHCHEGFKGRGLVDPQCESCNTEDWRHQAAAELRRLHAINAELVEALQEMLEIWEDDPAYGHEAADRARAALAKVEDSK